MSPWLKESNEFSKDENSLVILFNSRQKTFLKSLYFKKKFEQYLKGLNIFIEFEKEVPRDYFRIKKNSVFNFEEYPLEKLDEMLETFFEINDHLIFA